MVRILSIDGGGIRGIIPAVFLVEVEKRTGKKINELFDFIVGTSTGGIMSLLLTKENSYSAQEVLEFYTGQDAKLIFKPRFFKFPLDPVKFPSWQIEQVLRNKFGDCTMGKCTPQTVITFYDTFSRNSIFANSFEDKYKDEELWRVARATSAAPTYFEPYNFGNYVAVDGGMFANNPALFGLIEAMKHYNEGEKFTVVSLGTGSSVSSINKKEIDKFNLLSWATNIFDFVSDGQSDSTDYSLERLSDVKSYYRFQLKLNTKNASLDDISDKNLNSLINVTQEAIKDKWQKDLEKMLIDIQS